LWILEEYRLFAAALSCPSAHRSIFPSEENLRSTRILRSAEAFTRGNRARAKFSRALRNQAESSANYKEGNLMGTLQGTEYYISKGMGRAIMDYKMFSPGDKIAVAVSGGKDSLTLLRLLIDRQKFVPIKYEVMAIHIDMKYPKSIAAKLERYFKKLNVGYKIIKTDVLKKTPKSKINCFWCSWNRRKELFLAADKLGCTKIALGHHLDDIVETFLLNLFFQGEISTMKPKQELFEGKITLIRPLAYVEERLIKRFAKEIKLGHESCVCPYAVISNRNRMGRIIQDLEKTCPEIKKNIFRSLQRVKKDYLL
jgi:tRNA 2-thiocytidine biosynthesis protein TtcA